MYLKKKNVDKLLTKAKTSLISISLLESYVSKEESLTDTVCLLAGAIIQLDKLKEEDVSEGDCLLLALSKDTTYLSVCCINELLDSMNQFDSKLGEEFKEVINFKEDMVGDHFLISCVDINQEVEDVPIHFFRYSPLKLNKHNLKELFITVNEIESILKEAYDIN